ncbi:MAG: DUF1566 domain-containing protein, partial [Deltaproteobacteria bacterium]|nr:DUF1566 domain-containing protein [Deltaproteobacteria bacterium]
YKDDYGYVRCVRSGQLKIWLFNDNGNGTVSDSGTGLMWQKATAPGTYKWKDALKYCEDLTLAGYSDWRLPDIKELSSIVDDSKYGPAIDSIYFPDTKSDWYWSSSSDASDTSFAWGVGFSYGYVDDGYKGNDNYVRCVRSGQ